MAEYQTRFAEYVARKQREHGDKFDASALNPNFIAHYNAGKRRRVKVKFPWLDTNGEPQIVWGYVAVTTGWRPTFLLMRRTGQIGSSLVLGDNCQVIDHRDKP